MEEKTDEADGSLERVPTSEERREWLHLDQTREGAVCAASGHATSTQCSVDVSWNWKPKPTERENQSVDLVQLLFVTMQSLDLFCGPSRGFNSDARLTQAQRP